MDSTFLIVCLLLAFLCGMIGRRITRAKNRSGAAGFWLGFLFGPLGILIAAVLSTQYSARDEDEGDDRRPCPDCAELVKVDARKCRFCGKVFDAADGEDAAFDEVLKMRRRRA